ncbi:uncharacterized protein LOC108477994 [Gossypium arboreum]|uniref:uncharacterized protein LOC108477994 n=1 Tax=Gossypium arboreum TaxID=29729 RepID=UPI00081967F9|nr:uncharacterized protein LOC108477994 [Gossypium arboreum]
MDPDRAVADNVESNVLALTQGMVPVESRPVTRTNQKKRKAESEARDARKRLMGKSFHSQSKKSREMHSHSHALVGFSNIDRENQYSGYKAQTSSIASIGNRPNRSGYPHCGRCHLDKCRMNGRACFKCGFQDHFIKDCLEMT